MARRSKDDARSSVFGSSSGFGERGTATPITGSSVGDTLYDRVRDAYKNEERSTMWMYVALSLTLSLSAVLAFVNDVFMSYIVYGRYMPEYINVAPAIADIMALGVSAFPQLLGIAITIGTRLDMPFAKRKMALYMYYTLTVFDIVVDFMGAVMGHNLVFPDGSVNWPTVIWAFIMAVVVDYIMSEMLFSSVVPPTVSMVISLVRETPLAAVRSVKKVHETLVSDEV